MKEFIEGIRFVLVASIFVGIVWVGHVVMLTQQPDSSEAPVPEERLPSVVERDHSIFAAWGIRNQPKSHCKIEQSSSSVATP